MRKILLLIASLIPFCSFGQEVGLITKNRKWYIPDHLKLQYAGNIGFMAGGPGYVSKNKSLETDLLFGFMPRKFGGDALISITAKVTYSPWRIPLQNAYHIAPFSIGFYSSYTFGPQFDTKWPEYYPKGYYWWATSVRLGAFIGGKIGHDVKLLKKERQMELYYELGTYDLLFISYVQNTSYLKPKDIINLAFGLKMNL